MVNSVPVANRGLRLRPWLATAWAAVPRTTGTPSTCRPAQELFLQTSTPSDQGGQFPNTASLEISLYDTFGNLVATGVKMADGRNESLFFNAPISGAYHIQISEDPGGAGEYFLSVNTASYPAGGVSGEVYNDLTGDGNLDPGDPGLQGWEVDVFDSSDNFVASEFTDANGDFDIEGLEPGHIHRDEVVQAGWTQTAPPPGTFTVTVSAGSTVTGLNFGNFQDITISGEVFNDLNGDGTAGAGRAWPAGLDRRPVRRRRRLDRHHRHRRQRRLQLLRRRSWHLHRTGRAAARLDPDRPAAAGHLHRHRRPAVRTRPACSSATSSS